MCNKKISEIVRKMEAAIERKRGVEKNGLTKNQAIFCYIQALSMFCEVYGQQSGSELFWIMMPEAEAESDRFGCKTECPGDAYGCTPNCPDYQGPQC